MIASKLIIQNQMPPQPACGGNQPFFGADGRDSIAHPQLLGMTMKTAARKYGMHRNLDFAVEFSSIETENAGFDCSFFFSLPTGVYVDTYEIQSARHRWINHEQPLEYMQVESCASSDGTALMESIATDAGSFSQQLLGVRVRGKVGSTPHRLFSVRLALPLHVQYQTAAPQGSGYKEVTIPAPRVVHCHLDNCAELTLPVSVPACDLRMTTPIAGLCDHAMVAISTDFMLLLTALIIIAVLR